MVGMVVDPSELLTAATRGARSSVIREILALTESGDVLSLAGGMPSPETFPVEDLAAAARTAIEDRPEIALQYARTDGLTELRTVLADMATAASGRSVAADEVIVTTGSQQALDLIARAFLAPGDTVAIESPGYLGAVQALGARCPTWLPIPVDGDGLDTDALAAALAAGHRPKLVYTATDFQNPTGAVLDPDRRRHLARLADEFGFLVVEDDPYGAIRFGEPVHLPVSAWTDRCISLGTTSKTIAPGLRVGWAVGPPEVIAALSLLKQATDLNTSALTQHLALDLLRTPGWIDERTRQLRGFYRPRAELLADALRRALPDAEVPPSRGGLFLWLRLPGADTTALLPRAVDHGVAYVPGSAFHTDGTVSEQLRVSYATLGPGELAEAASRLGRALAR